MTKRKIESVGAFWTGVGVTAVLLAVWMVDLSWISDYGSDWPLVPSLLYGGACGWLARAIGKGVAGAVDDIITERRRARLLKAEYDRMIAEASGS